MTNTKIIGAILGVALIGGVAIWMYRQSTPQETAALQSVVLDLKWLNQAQFAGNYVAIEKGFYAKEGLKVTTVPFSYDSPPINAVVNGKADFGIVGADELVLARAKGMPVKAIAVIYKTNPVAAYALKSSGITKPQDFIGKTVGLERGLNVEYLYAAMMAKLGLDRSKVHEVTIGYDDKELLAGKTDVSTGYIINEPNQVIEAGKEVNTILMADYGVNMYADVLFAREDTIQSKPDMVQRFLKATLEGWQYAIEHESEAVTMTLAYATTSTSIHESRMFAASVPLIATGDSPLGWMDAAKWQDVQTILLDQKILAKPIVITDAYTMQFLNTIYNKK